MAPVTAIGVMARTPNPGLTGATPEAGPAETRSRTTRRAAATRTMKTAARRAAVVVAVMLVIMAIGLLADRILFSPWENFLHRRWGTGALK